MGPFVGSALVCSSAQGLPGSSLVPLWLGHQNVDSKTTDCQISLSARWVYLGIRILLQFNWVITNSPPHGKGRRTSLQAGKGVGRAIINKEFLAFHWLSP